ncbi:hypothetical protein Tco_1319864 [Tanacetum coccineum]
MPNAMRTWKARKTLVVNFQRLNGIIKDNSLDEVCNVATYVKIDMLTNKKDESRMLLIEDNGGEMDLKNAALRVCRILFEKQGRGYNWKILCGTGLQAVRSKLEMEGSSDRQKGPS